MILTRRGLLRHIDVERVERAIAEAELRTSGEIRVSVAPFFWGSVERTAERAFVRLGMQQTRARNGVLFFVVPARKSFVVLGDQGIHERVGQDFWQSVVAVVEPHFRRGHFTEGLLAGIATIGEKLGEHFPYDRKTDRDELPNRIDFPE